MRKVVVLGVVFAALAAFWLLQRGDHATTRTTTRTKSESAIGRLTRTLLGADVPTDEAAPPSESSDEESSKPLDRAPVEQDGAFDVRVTAGGKAVEGAELRLYWQGPRDVNTLRIDWRAAGKARSGKDGTARILARTGPYLLTVRHAGYAPTLIQTVRPLGEAITRVTVALEAGTTLTGKCEQKHDGQPVPLAELTLVLDDVRRPPIEERLTTKSDASGAFTFPPLMPGTYRLEGRAAGYGSANMQVTAPAGKPVRVRFAASAVLEGRVVLEDGVTPVADAIVSIAGEDEQRVRTGSSGGFSAEVTPGSYTIAAIKGDKTGGLRERVGVAAGATKGDLLIKLGESASIAGRVIDKNTQQPIAGAAIAVSPHGVVGDSGRGVSGADGQYVVSPLSPGTYDVVVSAPGYAEEYRASLTVEPGQRFPLDVTLKKNGAVAGVVGDEQGAPIADAIVLVYRSNGQDPETRSDGSGRYLLPDVMAGDVQVVARRAGISIGATRNIKVKSGETTVADLTLNANGTLSGTVTKSDGSPVEDGTRVHAYSTGLVGYGMPESLERPVSGGRYSLEVPAGDYRAIAKPADDSGSMFSGTVPAHVDAGQTTTLNLVIKDGAAMFNGSVLDAGGAPVAFAVVYYGPPVPQDQPRDPMAMTSTEQDGTFSFTRLRGVTAPMILRASSAGRTSVDVPVTPETRDVELRLRASAIVHGRVVGDPAPPSITVSASSELYTSWEEQGTGFVGAEFTLRDAPPGKITVTVTTPDGRSGETKATTAIGETTEVTVQLSKAASVRGRVLDAAAKKPVANVMMRLNGESNVSFDEVSTDADGRFEIDAIVPGAHKLFAWLRGYELKKDFSVAAGQALDLGELTMTSAVAEAGTTGVHCEQNGRDVFVGWVSETSPGGVAGLRVGDVVVAIDGRAVSDAEDAMVRLRGAPGSSIDVQYRRRETLATARITRAP